MASRVDGRSLSGDTLVSASAVKRSSFEAGYTSSCDSLTSWAPSPNIEKHSPAAAKLGSGHKLTTSRLLFAHVG